MYGYYTVLEILKLAAKRGVKRSTFPKKRIYVRKAFPKKADNIARGMTKKKKPKLRIV